MWVVFGGNGNLIDSNQNVQAIIYEYRLEPVSSTSSRIEVNWPLLFLQASSLLFQSVASTFPRPQEFESFQ